MTFPGYVTSTSTFTMSYIVDAMQPEPRNLFEPRLKFDRDINREATRRCDKYFGDDDIYYDKMNKILAGYPHLGVPREPSQIMGHLWLGTSANADNHALIKRYKFTHLLNCEGYKIPNKPLVNPFKDIGIDPKNYCVLEAMDDEHYSIIKHFGTAFAFIDKCHDRKQRVLVYSTSVNVGGAIAIGYLCKNGIPLLQATRRVKDERRTTLSNHNFMKQLVLYARTRGLLDSDLSSVRAREYGGPMDRRRINSTHLPYVLGPNPY